MRHYLCVMASPPRESSDWSYRNFTRRVKRHMLKGPFKDLLSEEIRISHEKENNFKKKLKQGPAGVRLLQLRREAAYLYDAVMLYARSLVKVVRFRNIFFKK